MAMLGREVLAAQLEAIQKGRCFICEEPIQREFEKWHIDHIIPRAKGGKDDENNYALTHEHCNLSKLDSDLRVARCMAKYEKIKGRYENEGPNHPNLGDFLTEFGGARHLAGLKDGSEAISIALPDLGKATFAVPTIVDKLAGMKSFFAELPIEYLFHDTRINPRAVGGRIRGLIEEFLSGHPQLHPSLGWTQISDGQAKISIFDGQHKAVAQMLLGIRTLPVRVFVDPDLDTLLETNTRAGTVLRQIAFDKSVQRFLGSQIFWEKVEAYRQATKRGPEDLRFSERDLVAFFKGEHREIKRYILDDVRTAVIHSVENKLKDYIEFGGKATQKPLSYNTIEKTFFSFFIHKDPMAVPMDHKFEIGESPRQLEKEQLIRLMNIFAEEVFIGRYDSDRGTYRVEEGLRQGESIPEPNVWIPMMVMGDSDFIVMAYSGT
jgi:hypothetical protein